MASSTVLVTIPIRLKETSSTVNIGSPFQEPGVKQARVSSCIFRSSERDVAVVSWDLSDGPILMAHGSMNPTVIYPKGSFIRTKMYGRTTTFRYTNIDESPLIGGDGAFICMVIELM